jgi:thiosulfate/3-mercaptopyruvate sulfurtransferase
VENGTNSVAATHFEGEAETAKRVLLAEVPALSTSLVDARDAARYRGEVEPIDPRAGHIPGARNHPFKRNLAASGEFLSPAALREVFAESLGTLPDATTVHYCGSGVSACHNVLAQLHAGLPEPRLYAGSWSEWCRDATRPANTAG